MVKSMKIYKLEDLEVWKEAMVLAKIIYELVKKFPIDERYNLSKHMKENARGVPANIGEGFGRYFYKENLRFYGISRGCLGEQLSDLHLAHQLSYITNDEFNKSVFQLEIVSKMLNGLINSCASSYNQSNNSNLSN